LFCFDFFYHFVTNKVAQWQQSPRPSPHRSIIRIRQVAPICTLQHGSLGRARESLPDGISIGSAVFARLTVIVVVVIVTVA